MSLKDKINKQAEQYGGGIGNSDMFEFKDKGLYRIRILTEPEVLATHFFGKGTPSHICYGIERGCKFHGKDPESKKGEDYKRPSIKLCCYVIDRKDGDKVKLAELPLSLSYSLSDLEDDEDFTFSEYPMPFDVKIMYDPENEDPKAKYRLQPSPKKAETEELNEGEQKMFDEKMSQMTPSEYVDKRKKKQMAKDGVLPPEETKEGEGIDDVIADEDQQF